jgi:hypothetical protein
LTGSDVLECEYKTISLNLNPHSDIYFGLDDVSIHLLMLSGTKSAYNVHVKIKYEYITHLDKHCSSKVIMNISINKNRSA